MVRDYDHLSETAAESILQRLARIPAGSGFNLGLATGATPLGLYHRLASAANAGRFSAAAVRGFNLDEYIGLPGRTAAERARHPQSFAAFMERELFGRMKPGFAATHLPSGHLVDPERLETELALHPADWTEQGADSGKTIRIRPDAQSPYLQCVKHEILDGYEQAIRSAGGIDLQVVGVGERGHVAFHEAGIPFADSRMLLVRLDENTRRNAVAAGHFPGLEDCPRFAVSMGAELVFEARAMVMLAAGARKAEVVMQALTAAPAAAVPISWGQGYLRRGGELLCILDREAAAGVWLHRREIQARGIILDDVST